jgi:hypothetical protein
MLLFERPRTRHIHAVKTLLLLLALNVHAQPPVPIAARFQPGVPDWLRALVTEDLEFMAAIRGSRGSELHQKIFGGPVDGERYLEFFNQRIKHIHFVPDDLRRGLGELASVLDRSLVIVDAERYRQMPRWERIGVLIHEARHVDDGPSHVFCPTGSPSLNSQASILVTAGLQRFGAPSSQGRACDNDVLGPYGVQTVMLLNIHLFCENCGIHGTDGPLDIGLNYATRIIGPQAQMALDADLAHYLLK